MDEQLLKLQTCRIQLLEGVMEDVVRLQSSYLTSSEGLVGLGQESSGTGEVASIRAGFRMIGRDMGGTPTCRGEARGCRMRGDWLKGEGAWAGDFVRGTGMGGMEGGAGDDRSDPGALGVGGSWGDSGLLWLCVSAGDTGTGTGEGGWAGGGDAWGDGGRPAGGGGCMLSAGGLGPGSAITVCLKSSSLR